MSYYPKSNRYIRDKLRCVDTSYLAAKKSLLAGKKSSLL